MQAALACQQHVFDVEHPNLQRSEEQHRTGRPTTRDDDEARFPCQASAFRTPPKEARRLLDAHHIGVAGANDRRHCLRIVAQRPHVVAQDAQLRRQRVAPYSATCSGRPLELLDQVWGEGGGSAMG